MKRGTLRTIRNPQSAFRNRHGFGVRRSLTTRSLAQDWPCSFTCPGASAQNRLSPTESFACARTSTIRASPCFSIGAFGLILLGAGLRRRARVQYFRAGLYSLSLAFVLACLRASFAPL